MESSHNKNDLGAITEKGDVQYHEDGTVSPSSETHQVGAVATMTWKTWVVIFVRNGDMSFFARLRSCIADSFIVLRLVILARAHDCSNDGEISSQVG